MLAASIPLSDDSAAKDYLLWPHQRGGLLSHHGAVVQSIKGANALEPLLGGRSFVCLHYKLGAEGALEPCTAEHAAADNSALPAQHAWYTFSANHDFMAPMHMWDCVSVHWNSFLSAYALQTVEMSQCFA